MNYFEGMFAHEPAPDAKAMTEHELDRFAVGECLDNALLAAFQESGHAVAGHILGHPCTKIVMDGDGNIPIPEGTFTCSAGDDGGAYVLDSRGCQIGKTFDGETIEKNGGTGTVFHSKKFTGRVNATLLRKRPLASWPKHITDTAISICAGPAAELRISKEEGLQLRLLNSSQGDHHAIEWMTKSPAARNLDRYDFQEMVWREAEEMMARADLWAGVRALAHELQNYEPPFTLSGRRAAQILRVAGL